jgi:cellulose synthase/poly-beta-1,6-N-acetylglucosamine synthase-like glycosyltransferase
VTIFLALKVLFWGALAVLVYAYIFYPILMAAISRHAKADTLIDFVADRASLPSVAVVVAAFNEQKHITARIENLLQQDYPFDQLQVLVGSDGSSDHTAARAREIIDVRLTVHDFAINRGKASVLNDLVARVNSDILVFTDANTVFEQDTVRQLVMAFDKHTGAVCGDLILEGQRRGSNQDHRYWNFERRLKLAESLIGGLLGANGGVYAIRREHYHPLRPDTICDDFVIAMNIAVEGKGLKYVPAAVAYEETPTDVVTEFHRRVRIGIGNYQALFRHPNYLLRGSWTLGFTYFSHKVLRWLTPHLLILILACSFFMIGDPLYQWLTILQLAGYAAATFVFLSRDRFAWPSAVRAGLLFAVLNVAFLVGFKRFLTADYSGGWRRTDRA